MAATNVDVKFVQVTIRLGARPSFEVSADARVRVAPSAAALFASSAEGTDDSVVLDILGRLAQAYAASEASLQVRADGPKLVDHASG